MLLHFRNYCRKNIIRNQEDCRDISQCILGVVRPSRSINIKRTSVHISSKTSLISYLPRYYNIINKIIINSH